MPKIFDVECEECFYVYEVIETKQGRDEDMCPICGADRSHPIWTANPVTTIGPLPSKPIRSEQLGRTFESNGELRRFLESRPDLQMVSPQDNHWKRIKDDAQNRADKQAQKFGYRDAAHKGEVRRRERVQERELKALKK